MLVCSLTTKIKLTALVVSELLKDSIDLEHRNKVVNYL